MDGNLCGLELRPAAVLHTGRDGVASRADPRLFGIMVTVPKYFLVPSSDETLEEKGGSARISGAAPGSGRDAGKKWSDI